MKGTYSEESKSKEQVRLAPPWIILYNEMEQLFLGDDEVKLYFEMAHSFAGDDEAKLSTESAEDIYVIHVVTPNSQKADALNMLLPKWRTYGNVTVKIVVEKDKSAVDEYEIFRRAFAGNRAFREIEETEEEIAPKFVVFEPKVVYVHTDDPGVYNRFRPMLYEDIARDVFPDWEHVKFGTAWED